MFNHLHRDIGMLKALEGVKKVVVGSGNRVKVAAVRAVVERVRPSIMVEGLAVNSGVSDQPWGDEETIRGARERAQAVHRQIDCDIAIGLEGGVVEMESGEVRTCAWAVALGSDGREGLGGSMVLTLPPGIVRRLREGYELAAAVDAEADLQNTGTGQGVVGVLTTGIVDRQRAYELLVAYALAPFFSRDFYP